MKEGGVPWDKILRMVNDAKKTGDPLANLINGMMIKNLYSFIL